MDRRTIRRTDKTSCRDARTHKAYTANVTRCHRSMATAICLVNGRTGKIRGGGGGGSAGIYLLKMFLTIA